MFDRPGAYTDVISVQSEVVYGCVGNSVALPALRRHGLRVAGVPTVLLSNMPSYPSCYGGEISPEWFEGFLQGLHERGQDNHLRAIITGYLGRVSKAEALVHWLKNATERNPHALIVIDPVLGDEDTGIYVDPGLVSWYRNYLAPMSTGLTPNRYELSCLTGRVLSSQQDVINAARSLIGNKTRWVAVTSASRSDASGTLQVLCVTADSVHIVEHRSVENAPRGTGDLFTAELTAGLLHGKTLNEAADSASKNTLLCVEEAVRDGSGLLNPLRLST